MRNIVIIGGDKRQKYLKEYLCDKGYDVTSYGLFDWDDDTDKLKSLIAENTIVLLPLPATRNDKTILMPFSKHEITIDRLISFLGKNNLVFGGLIKGELKTQLSLKGIPFVDYYDSDLIEKNAILTAFGALKIILEHIDFALPQGKYAITGYGRVAKETASVLTALSCDVTIFARNDLQRENAVRKGCNAEPLTKLPCLINNFDFVINTVPSQIIGEETLKNIRKDSEIMELASAPYGVDFNLARKCGVEVVKAFSLPGKYTPKSAGELIGEKIEENLQREE